MLRVFSLASIGGPRVYAGNEVGAGGPTPMCMHSSKCERVVPVCMQEVGVGGSDVHAQQAG
jgi:hypothetical protein